MSTTTSNYGLIKPALSDTADITQYNSNWDKIDTALNDLKPKCPAAMSDDGVNYHVTIDGITTLYNGLEITIVPNMTNSAGNPTLNLNTLGAKSIRLALSGNTSATLASPASFFVKDHPVTLMYDVTSGFWKTVDKQKPSASDLYGTVAVANGGTGATSASKARSNLGITPSNIGALPTVLVEGTHYGTLDQRPKAGTKGKIFFVTV